MKPGDRLLHYEMSFFLWQRHDGDAAIASMTRAVEMTDESIPFLLCALAAMVFHFGRADEGERWLARIEDLAKAGEVSTTGRTFIEVARKDTAAAIEWLERGRSEHDTLFVWSRAFCEQLGIIADERIREAMERLGLP